MRRLVFGLVTAAFAASPLAAAPLKVLAFGDSLTAGYGLASEEAFPVALGRRLAADGYEVVLANGGVSGNTTQMALARLGPALENKPDLVVLEIGGNDMLNDVPLATTARNLDLIIRRIRASGARLLLAGMVSAEHRGADYKNRFDALFPAAARRYGLPFYPFFLEGVAANPLLTQQGGLHPTRDGVDQIVARITPLVETTLDEMGGRR